METQAQVRLIVQTMNAFIFIAAHYLGLKELKNIAFKIIPIVAIATSIESILVESTGRQLVGVPYWVAFILLCLILDLTHKLMKRHRILDN